MGRKFLEDLGVKPTTEVTSPNDPRRAKWRQERKEYGFDSRDTWVLDKTMIELLYERVLLFEEVSILDRSERLVMVSGVEIPFPNIVEEIIMLCERILTTDCEEPYTLKEMWENPDRVNDEIEECYKEITEDKKRLWLLWGASSEYFWW